MVIKPHETDVIEIDWSAAEEVARLKSDQDFGFYSKMFAWYDDSQDEKNTTAYKFPHHHVDNEGNPGAAVVRACVAAIAVLNGGRGGADIPDSDRRGVWEHVAKHLRDAGYEPAELKEIEQTGVVVRDVNDALRETRSFEVRAIDEAAVAPSKIAGYAAVFDYEAHGEVIRKGAFTRSLQSGRDIKAYWSHENDQVLGRTGNGTLLLREDEYGLYCEIHPNLATTWGRDALAAVARGDVVQMSFAFVPIEERWSKDKNGEPLRELIDVELFEVSPVAEPWYSATLIEAKNKPKEDKKMEVPIEEKKLEERVAENRITPINASVPQTEQRIEPRFARSRVFRDVKTAYDLGQFVRAIHGVQRAREYCANNGIELRALTEGTGSAGGYTVPTQLIPELLGAVEQYGVFRRNAYRVPMSEMTANVPVLAGGATGYWVGEGSAITASDLTFSTVELIAKKLGAIVVYSNELGEDTVIDLGDTIGKSMATGLAAKEDSAGFNGDGTNTYGGFYGIVYRLANTGTAGVVEAAAGSSTYWSKIALSDFLKMIGKLPERATTPNVKWFCSKLFYALVMESLATAAGGNTIATLSTGLARTFLGYEVEWTSQLPATASSEQIVCVLGDLSLVGVLGERKVIEVAQSTEATVGSVNLFDANMSALRATERVAIATYQYGSSSEVGCAVALKTKKAS